MTQLTAACHLASMVIRTLYFFLAWWRHQMETFSALLAVCEENPTVTGEFPSQMQVTWSCDVFFDLRQNKRLSKQSWGWWFETPSRPLWRHCNGLLGYNILQYIERRMCLFVLVVFFSYPLSGLLCWHRVIGISALGPLFLIWFNFNPSMDK